MDYAETKILYFANYPESFIGLEACGGSHYWARELTKLGHEVVWLNAHYVKGFVVGNRTPTYFQTRQQFNNSHPITFPIKVGANLARDNLK